MRSCNTCPSARSCAGNNLHSILKQVYDLYTGGKTNKFEILDELDDSSEDLLLRFNNQVSSICWTKAALLAIADAIRETISQEENGLENLEFKVHTCINSARNAFEQFPWHLPELVEQAPDLYEAIIDSCPQSDFAKNISKRKLIKICKSIAYN